jgi:hypothetical protein
MWVIFARDPSDEGCELFIMMIRACSTNGVFLIVLYGRVTIRTHYDHQICTAGYPNSISTLRFTGPTQIRTLYLVKYYRGCEFPQRRGVDDGRGGKGDERNPFKLEVTIGGKMN